MAKDLVLDGKLSKDSYSVNNTPGGSVDGWARLRVTEYILPTNSNFAAQLYKGEDGTYKIAYRGTNDWGAGDREMNKGIVTGHWSVDSRDDRVCEVLGYAVGSTASFLSFLRAVQSSDPKPLPIATSGVNTLIAFQGINGHTSAVLSGTGAALSAFTSLYSLQQNIKTGDALGAFDAGAQKKREFLSHSICMNVSASNEEMWRMQA